MGVYYGKNLQCLGYNHKLRRTVKADLKRIVEAYNHFGEAQPEPQKSRSAKEGLLTQNQARVIIGEMGISDSILDKPFEQLNNSELKLLSKALR